MSDYVWVLVIGAGFFLAVNGIAWSVFAGLQWWADRRHYCWESGSWCEKCIDVKQRMYAQYQKENAR